MGTNNGQGKPPAATVALAGLNLSIGLAADTSADQTLAAIATLKSEHTNLGTELVQARLEIKSLTDLQSELAGQHEALQAEHARLNGSHAEVIDENNQLAAENGARTDTIIELTEKLAAAAASVERLEAERDNLEAERDKAIGKYRIAHRRQTGKGRKCAPLDKANDADDVIEAIDGEVELVFSDGAKEIVGLEPMTVTGSGAWLRHPNGVLLKDRVILGGPAAGERAYSLAGIGLYVDGRQVAWCQLHDPIAIPAGGTAELRDSIIF